MSLSSIGWLLLITLQSMVPITLTAVGEVIGETAGLFNIGLEGILLLSAFTGALTAIAWGPIVGLLVGMGTGALVGFVFSVVNTYWKGSQMVTGIGINLFGMGLVGFGLVAMGPGIAVIPAAKQLVRIPLLGGLVSPIIFVTLVIPFLAYWFLNRTRAGLIMKAVGESPEAADVAGIRVNLVRLLATTFGGLLAGLGGAYMTVAWIGTLTKNMSAGRGFIALATVVFSGLNPVLALVGGLVFGFFDALAGWIATLPGSKTVPWQVLAMSPYIVTLLVVAGVIGRVRFPKELGNPYKRE